MKHRDDCFSYAVSNDGVVVCHPKDIMKYESVGKDERESGSEALVRDEGTSEDQSQGDSEVVVEDEGTREDECESKSQTLVEYENTKAITPEEKFLGPLLQRRGISLSRVRLSLSTLVNLSGDRTGEHRIADIPDPETDNYEFITHIAIDGEGIIDLMRTRSTRHLVVRKTVDYARSTYAKKPTEAAMLQDILPDRHPNIIQLHAFEPYDQEGARYYLEYCPGGDLHQLVNQYKRHRAVLPEPFIWHVYKQLLSALDFLHRGFDPRRPDRDRKGICHRDIKPSNVFLRPNADSIYPDVVLADFGHATLDFATYDPAGTTFWQPPELPRHSPKGDVYSLGAVIHFLIHFEAPMAKLPDGMDETSQSVRAAWVAAPEARRPVREFVEGYSEELVCMMLVALEADENKRRNSSRLLEFVSACVEMKFPGGSMAEKEPLAPWAFDHVVSVTGGDDGEETGSEQYFDMMEWCGCGGSMESSRSFPSASSSSPFSSGLQRAVRSEWAFRAARDLGKRY